MVGLNYDKELKIYVEAHRGLKEGEKEYDENELLKYKTNIIYLKEEHLNANCTNCPYNNNYTYTMPNGKTMKLKRIKISTCTFYLTD